MKNANLQLIIWEHKHLYFVESLKINFKKKYFVNGKKCPYIWYSALRLAGYSAGLPDIRQHQSPLHP